MTVDGLPWHDWPWHRRCRARGGDGQDWGRCELLRGHDGLHALERGMYVLRFGISRIRYDSPVGIPPTPRREIVLQGVHYPPGTPFVVDLDCGLHGPFVSAEEAADWGEAHARPDDDDWNVQGINDPGGHT